MTVPGVTGINRWRYGSDDPAAYIDCTPQQCLRRYIVRDATIVLGSQDRDRASLLLAADPGIAPEGR